MFLFKRLVGFVSQSTRSSLKGCSKEDNVKKIDRTPQSPQDCGESVSEMSTAEPVRVIEDPLRKIDGVRKDIRSIWSQY